MDTSYVLFIVMLFVAIVLALEGLYQVWVSKNSAEAKRVAARLRTLAGASAETPLTIERGAARGRWSAVDDALVTRLPSGARVAKYVDSAGAGTSVTAVVVGSLLLAAAGAALPVFLAKPWAFSLLFALMLGIQPWWWLARRRASRIRVFERQIPEALDMMGRALRAGHAFPTAVKMVGDEMAEPLAKEFRVLFDQTNFGAPLQDALMRLADRVPVEDLRYFVIAVLIQRESGGNLAELLDNISSIVRARLKLLGEVRTLSAEGRLSAWILGLLPFGAAAVINLANPDFLHVLWVDPAGVKFIGGALVMMLFGVLWMRSIIDIRV